MKVNTIESIGITEIFLGNNYDHEIIDPPKEPFIYFKMPYSTDPEENDEYHDYYRKLKRVGLIRLGMWDRDDEQLTMTITSDRKVCKAIDIFLSLHEYKHPENDSLFTELNQYKNQCLQRLSLKSPKQLPPKSKSISLFKIEDECPLQKSTHHLELITRESKSKKQYVFKKSLSDRSITEIEAFNGHCYRLLLGKRHPKVKSIHDEQNQERIGVASELIPGFISISDARNVIDKSTILKSELIKVLVAGYTEEDADVSTCNIGFDETGFCVKIDDDWASWPLTSKYKNYDPDSTGGFLRTAPIHSFKITQQDIDSFPLLHDASPHNWVDRNGGQSSFAENVWAELENESKFFNDKHYMFLKRILIPETVYANIGLAIIGSENMRTKHVEHKCNKTEILKNALLYNCNFQNYILHNPLIINHIIEEFTDYNSEFKKKEDAYLRVDLAAIRQNFENIQATISNIQSQTPTVDVTNNSGSRKRKRTEDYSSEKRAKTEESNIGMGQEYSGNDGYNVNYFFTSQPPNSSTASFSTEEFNEQEFLALDTDSFFS